MGRSMAVDENLSGGERERDGHQTMEALID